MSTVTLSITSEVTAEDVEELLEALQPIIKMVIPSPGIHVNVDSES